MNPEFPSLNLAQCVLVMAYEWRRLADDGPGEIAVMAGTEAATALEVEKLAQHYQDRLDDAGFFHPPEKAPGMKITLRNLWSRMALTRADVADPAWDVATIAAVARRIKSAARIAPVVGCI